MFWHKTMAAFFADGGPIRMSMIRVRYDDNILPNIVLQYDTTIVQLLRSYRFSKRKNESRCSFLFARLCFDKSEMQLETSKRYR